MLTPKLKHEIETVVETAIMLAEPGTSNMTIAERLYESEPALMEEIKKPLAIDRLIWTMKRRRPYIPSQNQMMLPGFPNLPQRIRLQNGFRPLLMQSTVKQLKEFREI